MRRGDVMPGVITINTNTPDPQRMIDALAKFRRQIAKTASPTARTSRKARQRRQWHKAVYP